MATVSCLSAPDTERRLRRKRLASLNVASGDRIPALRLAPTKSKPQVRLQEIQQEPNQPFALRDSACRYLEAASAERRCLAGDTQPIPLDAQILACMTEDHDRCPQYRSAMGLRATPMLRLAAFGICMLILSGMIVFAGFQAIQSAEAASRIIAVGSGVPLH